MGDILFQVTKRRIAFKNISRPERVKSAGGGTGHLCDDTRHYLLANIQQKIHPTRLFRKKLVFPQKFYYLTHINKKYQTIFVYLCNPFQNILNIG